MSEFQKWVEKWQEENEIDAGDLSSNTFGTMVWDSRQAEIDQLKKEVEALLERLGKSSQTACLNGREFEGRLLELKRDKAILEANLVSWEKMAASFDGAMDLLEKRADGFREEIKNRDKTISKLKTLVSQLIKGNGQWDREDQTLINESIQENADEKDS